MRALARTIDRHPVSTAATKVGAFLGRFTVTAIAVAIAAVIGWRLWFYYLEAPWTRDGRVRADVVQVAADVSGLVSDVQVHDNEQVKKGQVLFRIDPARFEIALRNAQADVDTKLAAAQEAERERHRYDELTSLSVSQQQQQQYGATAEEADATYEQALASRDLAALNLARSQVHAPVNGYVTNFDMRPGDYVDGGKPLFALIDSDSYYVDGYFEETKLPRIKVGDPARVYLVGENATIDGHVQSIAGGIADRERQGSADLLANVNPTFSWVRLAQRVPVRIALDHVPPGVRLVSGRTATVVILPGDATAH
ncbi:MAG TPA: HlyD family secretion protein [Acetobacteraceae bacterium]|jgi:multidrug resistance efflux pump|nr:HlyD family secretion protein [Acetobacteraceae bacterium]